jgi:ABC-type multidrug transport system ATPase subunit
MIASCFAFKDFMQTRNNFQSNILVLDEFIDSGIDSLAINGVIKILKEFVKRNKQNIYVISHRTGDLDNSVFDTIIQIEKKNNLSTVKYLNNEK